MSASTSRKRKNQPVEKPRPSVFDRLGTKANQPQQQAESSRTNFCHHWRDTGNCPFGANCKNAAFHALISPSKRAKGSDKDLQSKDQSNRKEAGRGKKGKGKEWSELDEGELERRKQQLQKELDLQNRQEMKKKSNKKKRSSSSSSTSSTQSSSNTSKNSSVKSSQPKPRKPRNRKRKGKGGAGGGGGVAAPKPQPKEADPKRMRDPPKDIKKRSNSASRQDQRSRSKHRTSGSATKKRKNSTSSENSSMERRRQQSKSSSHQSKGKARSPTPDRKKKQPPATYDKKSPPRRRDSPGNRRGSPGRGSNRKRSVSPRPRRRTPSPRGKVDKKHVESRNNSPVVSCRQRSPSPEKKEGRRAQTPPSPHDRGHPRGGRGSRRNSPEPRGQLRDRNRAQGARSPDRRNRGHSREPRESAVDKRDRRDHCSPLPSKSHVGRISPDSVRPSSRDRRDARDDSSRDKGRSNKESDRDRRRDGGQEKGRDRGRAREDELPSLMNIMTQHPAQYSPRRGRDEPQDYRGSNRDRGRHERFEERGDAFPPADDHPRGSKRPRRESPVRQRSSQKGGRDWSDHPEQRDKDWERRGKGGGNSSHREWDDPSRQRSGGKGSHRRGPSPVPASPKIPKEIEERPIDENKGDEKCDDKRAEKQVEEDIADSQSKKIAQEGDDSGTRNLDQAESDFSDFSDDADDILNADVVEDEPVEVIEAEENQNSAMGGADGDKDEDEQVEDILDDMDFEEISDGELDAEDIKAGADALSVDWAALLNQTRQTKREETDSFVNRWDIGSALSRIGVPLSVKGKFDLSSIGLQPPDKDAKSKIEGGKMRAAFLFDEDNKIQDEVPGVHAAIVLKKEEIANILNPKYHRGIDFAYGDQLRKICPFKNSETTGVAPFNEGLHQLALDMLRGSCDPNDVQQRINSCIVKSEV